jgi:hypothetical protein
MSIVAGRLYLADVERNLIGMRRLWRPSPVTDRSNWRRDAGGSARSSAGHAARPHCHATLRNRTVGFVHAQ